ncbi:hypothetical protein HJC23_004264 [Cyclotella cryptica]|uniref:Excalibur calcium-binding domain-containing protein n=1 Tax=Cyclotella cryptica TaxID=29204 RepID=A0ABD3PGJ7_9STRA|eukprot:CCRYP_014651-RA/>CCRYP_014651-RA protein AED:0.10 eAED:0.08 QI:0/-1/0/1/-1/1/1/0/368
MTTTSSSSHAFVKWPSTIAMIPPAPLPLQHPQVSVASKSNDFMAHPSSYLELSTKKWLLRQQQQRQPTSNDAVFPNLLLAHTQSELEADDPIQQLLTTSTPRRDTVKRIIDSSTVQLASGYVTLDTVRGAGSTYSLPECMDKTPAYKLKQFLPKGTEVRVYDFNSVDNAAGEAGARTTPRRVWIVRSNDDFVINRELVRTGYAFVRKGSATSVINDANMVPVIHQLNLLEQNARQEGLGVFKICTKDVNNNNDDTAITNSDFVAEFEPLEYTTQTQWKDDGGTTVVVPQSSLASSTLPPNNPGDIKGCSDFNTYEEALAWYETYAPYYGDVANLDRDGDGVPCPGLPHTTNRERYRMKRPLVKSGPSN